MGNATFTSTAVQISLYPLDAPALIKDLSAVYAIPSVPLTAPSGASILLTMTGAGAVQQLQIIAARAQAVEALVLEVNAALSKTIT